mgnify:FL=1
MTLKEKLELLWKYLLLAVLVYAVAQMGNCHRSGMIACGSGQSGHDMMWFGDDGDMEDMDIDVNIESFGEGDSSIQVIINGETVDLKDMEKMGKNIFVKKMHGSDEHEQHEKKNIKIIKKKITDK